jgi:hypothetical protein
MAAYRQAQDCASDQAAGRKAAEAEAAAAAAPAEAAAVAAAVGPKVRGARPGRGLAAAAAVVLAAGPGGAGGGVPASSGGGAPVWGAGLQLRSCVSEGRGGDGARAAALCSGRAGGFTRRRGRLLLQAQKAGGAARKGKGAAGGPPAKARTAYNLFSADQRKGLPPDIGFGCDFMPAGPYAAGGGGAFLFFRGRSSAARICPGNNQPRPCLAPAARPIASSETSGRRRVRRRARCTRLGPIRRGPGAKGWPGKGGGGGMLVAVAVAAYVLWCMGDCHEAGCWLPSAGGCVIRCAASPLLTITAAGLRGWAAAGMRSSPLLGR